MNITLALVLGAAGAILILLAASGGGFTVSVVSMPKVGVFPRVVSFVMGAALVFSAFGVYDYEALLKQPPQAQNQQQEQAPPQGQAPPDYQTQVQAEPQYEPPATPDPVRAPIVAPTGSTVYLFDGTDSYSTIVAELPDGQSVDILCTMQGESVTSEINGYTSSLWDGVSVGGGDMVGFVPDVYVGTPTYQPTMPNCEDLWDTTTTAT